MKMDQKGFYRT